MSAYDDEYYPPFDDGQKWEFVPTSDYVSVEDNKAVCCYVKGRYKCEDLVWPEEGDPEITIRYEVPAEELEAIFEELIG